MNWQLHIQTAALNDIEEAAEWYETRQAGLGVLFAQSVLKSINSLVLNPLMYRLRNRRRHVRWLYPDRFPYRIVYCINCGTITIIAVIHAARKDTEWKRRL